MTDPVEFDDLFHADLHVDRVYRGGLQGNLGDDPIARLLPVGNQGGFRPAKLKGYPTLLVLYSSRVEPDWPDHLDPTTGDYTYYGDNRRPGAALLETPRGGNRLLDQMFTWSRSPEDRAKVPPTFLFTRDVRGRDVMFRGLLAPGSPALTAEEELVAIWRTTEGRRFQNYRAHFTVLNVNEVPRAWLLDLVNGHTMSEHTPDNWKRWVRGRVYIPLLAPRTIQIRSRREQEPKSPQDRALLALVHSHFSARPTAFESLAGYLWESLDGNAYDTEITRATRDGGRDATGKYRIGPTTDPISVNLALEAKCYKPGHGVGAKEVSRLISRLKRNEFGVLVTTSHITPQIYEEVREDQHPVIFITGADIVAILRQLGLRTETDLAEWLYERYPQPDLAISRDDQFEVELDHAYSHTNPVDVEPVPPTDPATAIPLAASMPSS